MDLAHGDLRTAEWGGARFVLAHSACFDEALLRAVAARCAALPPGALVATVSTRLAAPGLRLLVELPVRASWGDATVFVHQRAGPGDGEPAANGAPGGGGGGGEDAAAGRRVERPLIPVSDTPAQRRLRAAGAIERLVAVIAAAAAAPADSAAAAAARHAAVALARCAAAEESAARAARAGAAGAAGGGLLWRAGGGPPDRAAGLQCLMGLAQHPCGPPALVGCPGLLPALAGLLAARPLALAAAAADLLAAAAGWAGDGAAPGPGGREAVLREAPGAAAALRALAGEAERARHGPAQEAAGHALSLLTDVRAPGPTR